MNTRSTSGRPSSRSVRGVVRMRCALALAGCGVLGVGLSACESTEQESSRIGHENEAAAHVTARPPARKHAVTHAHGRSTAHARSATGSGTK